MTVKRRMASSAGGKRAILGVTILGLIFSSSLAASLRRGAANPSRTRLRANGQEDAPPRWGNPEDRSSGKDGGDVMLRLCLAQVMKG